MSSNWHNLLGIGASIGMLLLIVPYIRSITQSTTRPSAVSWFGWALLFAIDTVAQATKGFDWSLAIPLISTFSTAIIAFIALRNGRAVWTRADKFCIALAVLAVLLWIITKEPLAALILSTIADVAVTIPTLVKTYQEPESEPVLLWMLYTTLCILEIVATTNFTIYNLLVPLDGVLTDLAITWLALRGYFLMRAVK